MDTKQPINKVEISIIELMNNRLLNSNIKIARMTHWHVKMQGRWSGLKNTPFLFRRDP